MARPKKYDIDTKQIIKLASYGCTNLEIADFFGCDESLLRKSYSEFLTKGKVEVKIRLRQLQMQRAVGSYTTIPRNHPDMGELYNKNKPIQEEKTKYNNDGSVPMLIWLGKQILGQSDKQEVELIKPIDEIEFNGL